MGSAVVITIDLCPRRPALCAKCRAQSTYGSGQNCSGAIADPPVAPGSARSGSRNCLNARVSLYAIVGDKSLQELPSETAIRGFKPLQQLR
jgi:hypothetical protein